MFVVRNDVSETEQGNAHQELSAPSNPISDHQEPSKFENPLFGRNEVPLA